MPASLIAIPYTILEISTFLGQLPVDDDDDDEKCQLNASLASLRSELSMLRHNYVRDGCLILYSGQWERMLSSPYILYCLHDRV